MTWQFSDLFELFIWVVVIAAAALIVLWNLVMGWLPKYEPENDTERVTMAHIREAELRCTGRAEEARRQAWHRYLERKGDTKDLTIVDKEPWQDPTPPDELPGGYRADDLYAVMASEAFCCTLNQVTPRMRKQIKQREYMRMYTSRRDPCVQHLPRKTVMSRSFEAAYGCVAPAMYPAQPIYVDTFGGAGYAHH